MFLKEGKGWERSGHFWNPSRREKNGRFFLQPAIMKRLWVVWTTFWTWQNLVEWGARGRSVLKWCPRLTALDEMHAFQVTTSDSFASTLLRNTYTSAYRVVSPPWMSGLCIWGAGDAWQCAHSCTHTSLHDEFRCWRRKLGAPSPTSLSTQLLWHKVFY